MATYAPAVGISGVVAEGDCGPVVSVPGDFEIHRSYAEEGSWASRTTTVLKEFFARNGASGTYLDIGANIGLTTIPIVQAFPRVRCLAFEPEPRNFRNLAFNLAANCRHIEVKLYQKALFKERSVVSFELAAGNLGDHRLRPLDAGVGVEGEHLRQVIDVEAVPLDDFAGDVRGSLAAKIDVQGAEPFVFEGGTKVLREASLIVVEWCPYMMKRLGGDFRVVLDFISTYFERCDIVEAEGGGEIRRLSAKEAVAVLKEGHDVEALHHVYYDLMLTGPKMAS